MTSAPRLRTSSAFCPLAVVATVAPRCLASWMAVDPRPPEPAWMRTFWPSFRGAVDQGLPSSQCHQRHRRRLVQGERVRFGRDVVLVDRDVFREGPDPQVAGAGVDLIAHLEVAYGGADPGHHPGDIVAKHERGPVLQELFELAVADHLVERVDTGGAHLDQHVTVADLRLGYLGGANSVRAVLLDDECLHDRSPSE